MKRLLVLSAAIAASALFASASGAAPAANTHVCNSIVDWKNGATTGNSPLGSSTVSGATITAAASMCHGNTLAAFVANKAWSEPDQVCKNHVFDVTKPVTVWALDRFADMPGLFNRVESYTVECGLKGAVPALSPAPPYTVTN